MSQVRFVGALLFRLFCLCDKSHVMALCAVWVICTIVTCKESPPPDPNLLNPPLFDFSLLLLSTSSFVFPSPLLLTNPLFFCQCVARFQVQGHSFPTLKLGLFPISSHSMNGTGRTKYQNILDQSSFSLHVEIH